MSVFKQEESQFIWNQRDLKQPSISTFKLIKKDSINLNKFYNLIKEATSYFNDNFQPLKIEYRLLRRCIYRQSPKFRSSKALKALSKLSKALARLFEHAGLTRILNNILALIPKTFVPGETYLPTKNLIDHLLIRLMGVAKLLVRIIETACICHELYSIRVRIGHFWQIAAIMIGLVSRVFVIAKDAIRFTCNFYENLLPFSKKLENHGPLWLPSSALLPADIKEWLEIDESWLEHKEEEIIEIFDTSTADQIDYLDLVDDDSDVEILDEYIELDDSMQVGFDKIRSWRRRRTFSSASVELIEMRGFAFDAEHDIGQVIEVDEENDQIKEDIVEIPDDTIIEPEVINLDTTVEQDNERMEKDFDAGVEIVDITKEDEEFNNKSINIMKMKRRKLTKKLKKQRNLLKSKNSEEEKNRILKRIYKLEENLKRLKD